MCANRKPEHAALMSNATAFDAPSSRCSSQESVGSTLSAESVAARIISKSFGSTFASSNAPFAAFAARLTRVSSTAKCLEPIPVRLLIHSSEVSIILLKSSLVTSRFGSALPKREVTNDDLSRIMDTSDEWIKSRTGIGSRHLAVEETLVSLAANAAKGALEEANVLPKDLDMILAATLSADNVLPTLSCELQRELGASNAVAFDINAACSGFLFAHIIQ